MNKVVLSVIVIVAVVFVYFSIYAFLRVEKLLIRSMAYSNGDNRLIGDNFLILTFHPAWILERKTRSLMWRIGCKKDIFGHVNY